MPAALRSVGLPDPDDIPIVLPTAAEVPAPASAVEAEREPFARAAPDIRPEFRPPIGLLQSSVRSLAELELAMRPEDRSLVGVHPERLAAWIENVIGDPAGAAAVREATGLAPCYADTCKAIQRVIAERVANARLVVDSAGHGQGGEPAPG